MRIIFFGTPQFVIPILDTLRKKFDIIAVVTAPDKKAGRKQLLTPSPVKTFVQNELYKGGQKDDALPIFTSEEFSILNSLPRRQAGQLSTLKPDLFIVAAYGYILPKELLDLAPFGALNVHPSLLPKYRGPTPVQTALLNGDEITGVTIIKMDEEMDHGPILAKNVYKIHETDTSETLLNHLFNLSAEMLPDVITNYTNGKIQPESQDDTKATYTKKITKDYGYVDIENPPDKKTLANMIRAYHPWPTVWTKVRIKNQEARIKLLPGGKIQMEGKNPVAVKDFVNGYPDLKLQLNNVLKNLDS